MDTTGIQAFETDPAVAGLSFDALGPGDLANLILQRSEVLADRHRPGQVIRAWQAGDTAPMAAEVARLGAGIARRAAGLIHAEYLALRPVLAEHPPARVADIGCGYALFDLFLARDFGADLVLIDIETNDRRHFGFQTEGAAYASLAVTRALLQENGIAEGRIATVNPTRTDLGTIGSIDLAVSFLSCGFHYPVNSYVPFLMRHLQIGGRAILDLRAGTADAQSASLAPLGPLTVLPGPPKSRRVMVTRR